jgi:hypothetical protein
MVIVPDSGMTPRPVPPSGFHAPACPEAARRTASNPSSITEIRTGRTTDLPFWLLRVPCQARGFRVCGIFLDPGTIHSGATFGKRG